MGGYSWLRSYHCIFWSSRKSSDCSRELKCIRNWVRKWNWLIYFQSRRILTFILSTLYICVVVASIAAVFAIAHFSKVYPGTRSYEYRWSSIPYSSPLYRKLSMASWLHPLVHINCECHHHSNLWSCRSGVRFMWVGSTTSEAGSRTSFKLRFCQFLSTSGCVSILCISLVLRHSHHVFFTTVTHHHVN